MAGQPRLRALPAAARKPPPDHTLHGPQQARIGWRGLADLGPLGPAPAARGDKRLNLVRQLNLNGLYGIGNIVTAAAENMSSIPKPLRLGSH
jgi:hypothetical protein